MEVREEIRRFMRWMDVWMMRASDRGSVVEGAGMQVECYIGYLHQSTTSWYSWPRLTPHSDTLTLTVTLARTLTLTLKPSHTPIKLSSTDIHTYNEWIISSFTCIQQLDSLPLIISTHVPIITMNECKKEWFRSNE